MELLRRLFWHLGMTRSPSRYLLDGHGYSWLGKKLNRCDDVEYMEHRRK